MQNTLERKVIKNIDFNCDLAQMFGVYRNDTEEELLNYVSSVNVSCGFHAGDPIAIKNALQLAKNHNVVVGAHIGFNDIQGFGNRPVILSEEEIEAVVLYQVGAIMSFAKSYKMEIEHVRPHGAMYKMAAQDYDFSAAIAKAVKKCSQWLVYYGATGENMNRVESELNVKVAKEVFLNKIYNADGSIDYNAKDIVNTETSITRLKQLLAASQVYNNEGGKTYVDADTVHFSSSAPNAIDVLHEARNVITPLPINYKNVYNSGWVE